MYVIGYGTALRQSGSYYVSIRTIEDLIAMNGEQLLERPNLGETSLREIRSELAKLGLKLRAG